MTIIKKDAIAATLSDRISFRLGEAIINTHSAAEHANLGDRLIVTFVNSRYGVRFDGQLTSRWRCAFRRAV